jgi:putative DNA primase/helicase
MNNRICPAKDPTTSPQSDLLKTATRYRDLGFSLFRIRTNGTKAPALRRWKHLQYRLPTDDELKAWFGQSKRYGIAIIGGAISGNLEMLDFDEIGLYETWRALCCEQGLAELLPRLVVVRTPSGGYHCYYRCTEPVPGNHPLARRKLSDDKIVVLAETRGEGGYTLAPGSPLECHKERKPYELVQGDFDRLPVFTRSERDALARLVEVFNEYVEDPPPGFAVPLLFRVEFQGIMNSGLVKR